MSHASGRQSRRARRAAIAPEEREAFAAAQAICARHARSFHFASHFLPRRKRQAAFAVYAFCRMIDDAVDQEGDAGDALATGTSLDARLAAFAAKLDEIYDDRLRLPPLPQRTAAQHALHAFALTVRRYGIEKQHFLELAEGCRMDLTINRYATWADLEVYCYRVAGVVGLIMCSVFEPADPEAKRQAVAFGNAMQLTNILRDVKEDWDRGRVYLPGEDLARFGYTEADIAAGVVDDRFTALMRFEIERARGLYRNGAAGLRHLANDGSRLTASAMGVIYGGILGAIERQRYDVYTARARLSASQKLARIPAAWRLSRTGSAAAIDRAFG